MDFQRTETSEKFAKKVLNQHYSRGFWFLVVLIFFFGMVGKLEPAPAKPSLAPTVERIPASEVELSK